MVLLFLLQPVTWLKKASEYKATILASPNFGYKLFLANFNPKLDHDIDLSSVRLIFNGSEPISTDICNIFLNTMEQYGLKKNAMFPVYGLAEATLAVSFPPTDEEVVSITLDRRSLGIGQTVKEIKHSQSEGVDFVDVGYPLASVQIRIVGNSDTPLPENTIGNIQLKGKNMTRGYFNNEEETKKIFTKDGWLNTGDLGFLRNGRLIVTGRVKDIIFVRGQNYYSHDIERVAEEIEGIEMGMIAVVGAFSRELQQDELVIFVLEKGNNPEEFAKLAVKIKRFIKLKIGLDVSHIIPITKLPKTTSGKIQRNLLREKYLNGEYKEILDTMSKYELESDNMSDTVMMLPDLEEKIKAYIVKNLSEFLDIPLDEIDSEADFFTLSIDSMTLMALLIKLENEVGIKVSPVAVLNYPNIKYLSKQFMEDYCKEFNSYFLKQIGMAS